MIGASAALALSGIPSTAHRCRRVATGWQYFSPTATESNLEAESRLAGTAQAVLMVESNRELSRT